MIPEALAARPKWVCWRYEDRGDKRTKVPVCPDAGGKIDATDSVNWNTLESAKQGTSRSDVDGIGFVFNTDGPIAGVDIDDCRVPSTGTIFDTAQEIIDELDSFTEISPSGTGVHIYVEGDLSDGKRRNANVEIYEGTRFFTVTGNHLTGTPETVQSRNSALQSVHEQYLDPTANPGHPANDLDHTGETYSVEYDHNELIQKAKQPDKTGASFRRLWNGDYSHQDSHSEGRLELYNYLAFWTGKDRRKMWELFKQSGMYPHPDPEKRGKCNRLKDVEIRKAILDTNNSYDPNYYDSATEQETQQPTTAN